MDYELLSYAFVAMSLGLMLGTLFGKRKLIFLPLLFSVIAALVLVMKALDHAYYNQYLGGIENIELYIMYYSAFVLFITFICK